MELIAQLLLESRTGAYIDWLYDNLIRLIIIHKYGLTISIAFCQKKPASHKAYHIPWSWETIPTSRISLASTLCTQGLFTPVAGDA